MLGEILQYGRQLQADCSSAEYDSEDQKKSLEVCKSDPFVLLFITAVAGHFCLSSSQFFPSLATPSDSTLSLVFMHRCARVLMWPFLCYRRL